MDLLGIAMEASIKEMEKMQSEEDKRSIKERKDEEERERKQLKKRGQKQTRQSQRRRGRVGTQDPLQGCCRVPRDAPKVPRGDELSRDGAFVNLGTRLGNIGGEHGLELPPIGLGPVQGMADGTHCASRTTHTNRRRQAGVATVLCASRLIADM